MEKKGSEKKAPMSDALHHCGDDAREKGSGPLKPRGEWHTGRSEKSFHLNTEAEQGEKRQEKPTQKKGQIRDQRGADMASADEKSGRREERNRTRNTFPSIGSEALLGGVEKGLNNEITANLERNVQPHH